MIKSNPKLPAVDAETLRSACAVAGTDQEGADIVVVWCDRNCSGAIFVARAGFWHLFGPLTGFDDFLEYLKHAGASLPGIDSAEAWRTAARILEAIH